MKIYKLALGVLCVVFISIFITSCATTTSGRLHSSGSYENVFKACIQAASETNYGVTSTDMNAGLIVAERNLFGSSSAKVVRMNITVKQVSTGTEVGITVVPPPGTVGNIKASIDNFTEALKRKVPDVKVVSLQ